MFFKELACLYCLVINVHLCCLLLFLFVCVSQQLIQNITSFKLCQQLFLKFLKKFFSKILTQKEGFEPSRRLPDLHPQQGRLFSLLSISAEVFHFVLHCFRSAWIIISEVLTFVNHFFIIFFIIFLSSSSCIFSILYPLYHVFKQFYLYRRNTITFISSEIFLYLYSFRDILYFIGYNQGNVPIITNKEYL